MVINKNVIYHVKIKLTKIKWVSSDVLTKGLNTVTNMY